MLCQIPNFLPWSSNQLVKFSTNENFHFRGLNLYHLSHENVCKDTFFSWTHQWNWKECTCRFILNRDFFFSGLRSKVDHLVTYHAGSTTISLSYAGYVSSGQKHSALDLEKVDICVKKTKCCSLKSKHPKYFITERFAWVFPLKLLLQRTIWLHLKSEAASVMVWCNFTNISLL